PFPLDRNPVPSEEISQEKVVVCSDLERNAVQKERIKAESGRRSLSSYGISEEISDPSEWTSNKHLLEPELQESSEESQELGSGCNRQSLALPVIRKFSALQDVARRQKPVSTWYQGLEGFFVVGTNPGQGILEPHSSLCAASSPRDSSIPFPGDGQWVSERSLSEYADDSVVQGVLKTQLNRPLNDFKAQNKSSPLV
ncbi:ZBBX protein, partial [Serilophus lunatus]|nr:ZBBX protein [Serilophus lunatus]